MFFFLHISCWKQYLIDSCYCKHDMKYDSNVKLYMVVVEYYKHFLELHFAKHGDKKMALL